MRVYGSRLKSPHMNGASPQRNTFNRSCRTAACCMLGMTLGFTVISARALPRMDVAVLSPYAVAVTNPSRAKPKPETPPAAAEPVRALQVVTAPGPDQAGYIHYWVITAPDGEEEIQVGIELADQRIAWSFPELGVQVRPFIANGEVNARGKIFRVQHLYGLRPFNTDTAMRALRNVLDFRVAYWVDNNTPYCLLNGQTREICMSCMGFAMQVLFPGKTPAYPEIPKDFTRIGGDIYHTTEDLLFYLTGLNKLPTEAARRERIAMIGGPKALHEELVRLSAMAGDGAVGAGATAVAETAKPPAKRRVSSVRPPAPKQPAAKRPASAS